MTKRLSSATVAAWLILLVLPLAVLAATTNWGASEPLYDETGVGNTKLADGDVVQLVWDMLGNGAAQPGPGGSPSGDDQLLASSTIGTGSDQPGEFSTNTPNTAPYYKGQKLYVRAWNDSSLSKATRYGDSPISTVDSNEGFTLDIAVSFATDIPLVPTAVDLAYFTATSGPDHVLLAWETTAEVNIIGFDLQRGAGSDGPWQKLNPLPIPTVSAGGVEGHAYSWADAAAPRGRLSYYRLDEVLMDGGSKPVAVTSAYFGEDRRLWLPIMVH